MPWQRVESRFKIESFSICNPELQTLPPGASASASRGFRICQPERLCRCDLRKGLPFRGRPGLWRSFRAQRGICFSFPPATKQILRRLRLLRMTGGGRPQAFRTSGRQSRQATVAPAFTARLKPGPEAKRGMRRALVTGRSGLESASVKALIGYGTT